MADIKLGALDAIESSFARAPVSLTLADLWQDDAPLVVANPSFLAMTGFERDEVLGRNCRFLQADLPNETARAEIRNAMRQLEACQVVLQNRRRQGDVFNNLLFLQPLRERNGDTRFVLGSQFELKDESYVEGLYEHVSQLDTALAMTFKSRLNLLSEQRRLLANAARNVAEAWIALH